MQSTEESHSTGDQSGETHESPATEGHFSKVWKCTSLSEIQGFPGGAGVKDSLPSAGNAGDVRDPGSIPGLGRSPEGENGNLFQFSCWKNPMDREDWRTTVHGVARVRHNWVTELAHTPAAYKYK